MLAALQPQLQLFDQPGGQPAAAFGLFLGQVNDPDCGHARAAKPARQFQPFVDPAFGHLHAFKRRGRAGEDHRHFLEMAAHHRHIAGVVPYAFILLEADLMRFVHHHQPEAFVRQEQGGARAHNHLCFAAGNRAPCAAPFG